jgi:hypothetical protein
LLHNAQKQQINPFSQQYYGSLWKRCNNNVKQCYGKWQWLLANSTKLSEYLHQEGVEELKLFRYKLQTEFAYYKDQMYSTFSCNENVMCLHESIIINYYGIHFSRGNQIHMEGTITAVQHSMFQRQSVMCSKQEKGRKKGSMGCIILCLP